VLKEREREGATEAERIGLTSLAKRVGTVTLLRTKDDAIAGIVIRFSGFWKGGAWGFIYYYSTGGRRGEGERSGETREAWRKFQS
jgi:hypothetical protein